MADFNFFLNRQGIQGRKGDKGDTGFTPTISVSEQTLNSYKLKITNEYNEFETPNLIGNLGVTDNGGTYLKYDPTTGTVSTGEIDGATTDIVGGVRKSTDDDLTTLSADTVVTPANVADMIPLVLEAGSDNVTIAQDDETSKTIITVTSETQDLTQLKAEVATNSADIETLKERTDAVEGDVTALQTNKQNKLVAGNGITIDADTNTISSTGSGTGDVSAAGNNTFTGTNTFTGDVSMTKLEVASVHDSNSKKYLNETDLDGQTISMVDGKVHVNMDELGNEVNDLSGRVTAAEADITTLQTDVTDINGDLDKKQAKLTAGANITLTDLSDGTVRIDSSGSGEVGDIPIASATTLGGVKIGENLSITDDGTLSATGGAAIDDATTTTTTVWSSSKTSTEIGSKQDKLVAGDNITIDPDTNTISSTATAPSIATTSSTGVVKPDGTTITVTEDGTISAVGGGSAPDNMVTTDTNQDITGTKTFHVSQQSKKIILKSDASSSAPTPYITVSHPSSNSSSVVIGSTYDSYYGGKHVDLGVIKLSNTRTESGIRMYSGSASDATYLVGGGTSTYGRLKISGSELIFTNNAGTETDLLASSGGASIDDTTTATDKVWSSSKVSTELEAKQDKLVAGDNITIDANTNTISANVTSSTPDNMVTTDTSQTITANKLFTGELRVGNDSSYQTLAAFSNEELVDGDSTLLEHINLGSDSTIVVDGNLGKKVYENNAYAFKKYINVDDLSDSTIAMNNTISSQVAHMAMPSDKYVDLTLGASGTTYTAPADGWVVYRCDSTEASAYLNLYGSSSIDTTSCAGTNGTPVFGGYIPVKKGSTFGLDYINIKTWYWFRFIYAIGSEPAS